MQASKYNGGGRGDMAGFRFGPPAGTTTYGGPGVQFLPGGIQPRYAGDAMMGDPGLFSFLGKVARGVTGAVSKLGIPFVSGAAGIASGLLGGGRVGPGITPLFQPGGRPPLMQSRFQGGGQVPAPGVAGFMQRAIPGGATGMEGCGNGTRPNKSGYWLKGGQFVAPGSVCVKRRRMNPLNPRALSKAMRRIESAKRATTVLNRITIRKKC